MDWGSFSYVDEKGHKRRLWAFVMVFSWSRAIYVEFVRRADTASFIQCHASAFEYFGGVPRRCLYDNAKVVTLGRDEEGRIDWNRWMLDFSLRLGFELKLCQPYRAQTKGKVESGVKYVRGNLWPSIRFTDDADLNQQALQWCDTVDNRRSHGITRQAPIEMLLQEQPLLGKLPERNALAPYLREELTVAWDAYVSWEGSRYRAHWKLGGHHGAGRPAVGHRGELVRRPAAGRSPQGQAVGQHFTLPGQWEGLPTRNDKPQQEAVAVQVPRGLRGGPLPGGLRPGGRGRCAMTTVALEQARQYLETLGLKQAVEVLDNSLDTAASKQLTYPEILADLLGLEVSARRERYLTTRTKLAHLPFPGHSGTVRFLLTALH